MYHSQGNYRLRLELGQLYRQSCSEHSGSYSIPNSSQENGLMVSHLSPRDNSSLNVAQKSFVPQTKVKWNASSLRAWSVSACSLLKNACSCDASQSMDQLLASTPESCPVIPQQVAASVPNRQATKSQKAEVQVSAVKNEMARSRCSKDAVRHSKNTGKKISFSCKCWLDSWNSCGWYLYIYVTSISLWLLCTWLLFLSALLSYTLKAI